MIGLSVFDRDRTCPQVSWIGWIEIDGRHDNLSEFEKYQRRIDARQIPNIRIRTKTFQTSASIARIVIDSIYTSQQASLHTHGTPCNILT